MAINKGISPLMRTKFREKQTWKENRLTNGKMFVYLVTRGDKEKTIINTDLIRREVLSEGSGASQTERKLVLDTGIHTNNGEIDVYFDSFSQQNNRSAIKVMDKLALKNQISFTTKHRIPNDRDWRILRREVKPVASVNAFKTLDDAKLTYPDNSPKGTVVYIWRTPTDANPPYDIYTKATDTSGTWTKGGRTRGSDESRVVNYMITEHQEKYDQNGDFIEATITCNEISEISDEKYRIKFLEDTLRPGGIEGDGAAITDADRKRYKGIREIRIKFEKNYLINNIGFHTRNSRGTINPAILTSPIEVWDKNRQHPSFLTLIHGSPTTDNNIVKLQTTWPYEYAQLKKRVMQNGIKHDRMPLNYKNAEDYCLSGDSGYGNGNKDRAQTLLRNKGKRRSGEGIMENITGGKKDTGINLIDYEAYNYVEKQYSSGPGGKEYLSWVSGPHSEYSMTKEGTTAGIGVSNFTGIVGTDYEDPGGPLFKPTMMGIRTWERSIFPPSGFFQSNYFTASLVGITHNKYFNSYKFIKDFFDTVGVSFNYRGYTMPKFALREKNIGTKQLKDQNGANEDERKYFCIGNFDGVLNEKHIATFQYYNSSGNPRAYDESWNIIRDDGSPHGNLVTQSFLEQIKKYSLLKQGTATGYKYASAFWRNDINDKLYNSDWFEDIAPTSSAQRSFIKVEKMREAPSQRTDTLIFKMPKNLRNKGTANEFDSGVEIEKLTLGIYSFGGYTIEFIDTEGNVQRTSEIQPTIYDDALSLTTVINY